jgi:copper transport protein
LKRVRVPISPSVAVVLKRRALCLILVLIYSGWVVPSASAHAVLLRSNPEANSVLPQAPVQVELFFTETLEPNLSSIQVFDSGNRIVDAGDVRVDPSDPTRMTVTLHALPKGVYIVSWKALSAVDGHQTVGSFPFAVGDENAAQVEAIPESSTARLPFTALASKFLLLASLTLLVGQRLFIALIWNPAFKSSPIVSPDIWSRLYHIGLITVLLSVGLGMLSLAGQTAAKELAFPWELETGRILTETRLGSIWLARLALAMLAVWLAVGTASRWKDGLAFAVNLALVFTVTLTSHAATEVRPLLPMLGDWLHLVGMTFWLGGLVYLFTGVRHLQKLEGSTSTRLTSLLTSRFSIHAILFVVLIGLTGFYSAYLRVGSWPALLSSLYGHVLLIKQVFVAGLLIVGAFNLLVISPRLKRDRLQSIGETRLVSRFGKILMLDLMFAALLLANVSFLTYIPPARVVSLNTDITRSARVDDLEMELRISPGRVGQNTFTLQLAENGQPLLVAREVLLRFTSDLSTVAPSELELIGQGDGSFSARGTYLSLPGNWQVQAVIRREDRFDAFVSFNISLRNADSRQESTALLRQTGLLLLSISLLAGLLTVFIKAPRGLRLGLGAPLPLVLLGMSVFYLTSPMPVETARVNPIPPNSESIARGQELYSTACAACHGETGKGDGPVGLTLNPRPADLTQHAIPGVHPDAQLFEWITNGFPGSQMPAYKSTLSDTDRWHLVNFIRTLAPE